MFIVLLIFAKYYLVITAVFLLLEIPVIYYSLRTITFSDDEIIIKSLFGAKKVNWSEVINVPFYYGFGGKQFFYLETKKSTIKGFWSNDFKDAVIELCRRKNVRVTEPNSSWKSN